MERAWTFSLAATAALALMASAAAVVAQSGQTVVGQKDRRFGQEAVTLSAGGTLRFVNDDTVAHNVYVRDSAGANQPGVLQQPGETTDVAFPRQGDYQVLCAIHPRMRMAVRVQ